MCVLFSVPVLLGRGPTCGIIVNGGEIELDERSARPGPSSFRRRSSASGATNGARNVLLRYEYLREDESKSGRKEADKGRTGKGTSMKVMSFQVTLVPGQ
jgi:hypothetical protein